MSVWRRRLGCLLQILGWLACLAGTSAWAQDDRSAGSFRIEVRAPSQVRELLERHLELQRYREVPDLEEAELERLLRLAERDTRELVGTLGFFSPRLDIRREPGAPGPVPLVVVEVDPGPKATVAAVDIAFEGDIQQSEVPDAIIQRSRIRENWTLPAGRPWTQDAWDDAKTQALRDLVARRYLAGRVSDSLAGADAGANRVRLGLKLDSGPVFRLGPMHVSGMQRYDPLLAPRLARLAPGTIYDQDQIQRAQLRLVGSGYFDSAFIYVDPASDPAAAPVQVNVREAPLHRLVLGVGVSTDSGPRGTVEYTQNRLPGIGWRAVTRLQLERRTPFIETELNAIPGEDLWRWGGSARIERADDGSLVTNSQRLRFGRSRSDDRIDRNAYLQFDRSTVQAEAGAALPEDTGDGTALSANFLWNGRYFDRVPFPSSGFSVGAEIGGGLTLVGSKSPFQRTVLRGLALQPLERGRIQWRGEAGAVLASRQARVPASQLFRTGGDTSVRGYGLRDIGVERSNGIVAPGRYLAVGSVEWQRPIRRNGVETPFESALFVDAGAVADDLARLRPSYGVGAGVRYRSPLGPLQADLAYGVQPRRFRLHITLSTTF
ncbi:MAG TPA: BamA/TamA family outer membrane protein [Ramlibacter sp.]|jgi:translocation and assembly module TamA|uniref:autotransporter assembly complex protein TamA n=1 Tax=Ramlibacter sp. TaxID=1917967 RepID=UPI002D6649D5|nr:BamA/TamA family outer membrane protein [Ramlibacter sp.]HZY19088.1 BamA/TamA family outer membrane protein [Ramlibacter sp.]